MIVYAVLSRRPPYEKSILYSVPSIGHSKFTPGVTGEKGGDALTGWSPFPQEDGMKFTWIQAFSPRKGGRRLIV